MRKKELLMLYEQAYEKLSKLTVYLEEIKAENETLKAKISVLETEGKETKEESVTEIFPLLKEEIKPQVEFSDETFLGAKAIGRIVVRAAKHCNALTLKEETNEIKELVNLILGRTEVAKAEILKIVYLDCELDVKREMIAKEETDAEDYFISVRGQIV